MTDNGAEIRKFANQPGREGNALDSLAEAVYATDAQGRFTYISPSVSSLTGFAPELMIGQHFSCFIGERCVSRVLESFKLGISGQQASEELTVALPNGTRKTLFVTGSPIVAEGVTLGLTGVIVDITEHKRKEKKARKQAALLELLARHSCTLIGVKPWEMQGAVVSALAEFCDAVGADGTVVLQLNARGSFDKVIGWERPGTRTGLPTPIVDTSLVPGLLARLHSANILAVPNLEAESLEHQLEARSIYTESVKAFLVVPFFSAAGDIIGGLSFKAESPRPEWGDTEIPVLRSFATMIATALKRLAAEKELRVIRPHQQLAMKAAKMGVWTWLRSDPSSFFFPDWAAELGYDPVAYRESGGDWQSLVHPDDVDAVLHAWREFISGRADDYSARYRMKNAKGEFITLEDVGTALEWDSDGVVLEATGVYIDISRQVATERELSESRRKLLTLMDNLPGMAYRCANDKDWTMEFVSEGCLDLIGRPSDALLHNRDISYAQIIHPDDRQSVDDNTQKAVASDRPFTLQYRITMPDGSIRWVWERGRAVVENGGPVALEGFIFDITDRVIAEVESHKTRNLIEAIIQNAPLVIAVRDALSGEFIFWNSECERVYGFSAAEAVGSRVSELFDAKVVERFTAQDTEALARPGEPIYIEEELASPRAGLALFHRKFKIALPDETGTPRYIVVIAEDLTERRKSIERQQQLEAELVQSQKLESLGRLAGGIVHDFNNMLAAIIGYTEMVLDGTPPSHPQHPRLRNVLEASLKAEKLTSKLLGFSRRQVMEKRVVNLNSIIRSHIEILTPLIEESVELRLELDPDLPNVTADPNQIESVLMNLAVNARDAMPDGGVLTISTSKHAAKEGELQTCTTRPSGFVSLTVSDTGTGIPLELQSRVFEPFFTTKAESKGTGLGLSTVYGIVKQHDGTIRFQSEPGAGTVFTVQLPSTSEPVKSETAVPEEPSKPGCATVLVAEDNELVRKLVCSILQNSGFEVLESLDTAHACEIAEKYAGPIDMLLTDVVMPQMNGRELFKRVRGYRQGIRVLYMSGYAKHLVEDQDIDPPSCGFIQKPFSVKGLLSKVNEVLAE